MTSIYDSTPPLQPHLYEEWDDEDDRRSKAPLAAFLAGTQDPIEVAQAINIYIQTETSARLQTLNHYAATHTLDLEDRESGEWMDLYPPNAGAFAQGFIRDWCRISTAFPPHSEGQDRLIAILDELKRLPRWMAPETRPDENGEVLTSEFWKFGRDWIGLEDEFRRQKDDIGPFTHIPESCARWINFQSIMARLTAKDMIYCAPFTALTATASLNEPTPKIYDVDIEAAAQWIVWPLECRHVYVECLKKDTTTHYWEPWSKQRWASWKQRFETTAASAAQSDRTRNLASLALRQMIEVEMEIDEMETEGSISDSSD